MAAIYDGDNNQVFQTVAPINGKTAIAIEVLIGLNQCTRRWKQPEEQLASSLVKGSSNAKGCTLTEYINLISIARIQVLAEYGSDERSTSGLYLWGKWNRRTGKR